MIIVEDVCKNDHIFSNVVMTIGSFDGVHLGHQKILEKVVSDARKINGTAALLTMKPHPREYFAPEHAPNLITSYAKKMELLEKAGIDVVFFLNFDGKQASLEPIQFLEDIVVSRCHAKEMVVGHDFCFGRNATGNYEFLVKAGATSGIKTTQVAPLFINGERVSSTLIRECILQGDLDAVSRYLGRTYSIVGKVVSGRGIGTTLGFPTANIKPHHSAVPAHGVYVARVLIKGKIYSAAVNVGIAPTIRQEDVTIEAFLLDFAGNVVGNEIEVEFVKRIRPEQKYASHEELVAQIGIDVEDIRRHFEQDS